MGSVWAIVLHVDLFKVFVDALLNAVVSHRRGSIVLNQHPLGVLVFGASSFILAFVVVFAKIFPLLKIINSHLLLYLARAGKLLITKRNDSPQSVL